MSHKIKVELSIYADSDQEAFYEAENILICY